MTTPASQTNIAVSVPPRVLPHFSAPSAPTAPSVARRQLPSPARLHALLEAEANAEVHTKAGADLRLFEVGCDGHAAFLTGHIPGARYLDTRALERAPLWNKVDDDVLLRLLLALGIRHDCRVVLYGRNPLAAARAAQLLLYAGVADVRLLDGNLSTWAAAGLPLAIGAAPPYPGAAGFGAAFPGRPDYLIDMNGAKALLLRPDGALVSIRSRAEFTGLVSGYDYIAARGDIPGARWGRAGADGDINSMSAFQEADGRMKPAANILDFWRGAGIVPENQTAFYCGTGWRASLAFFYAWVMGWEHIAVFDGGWFEWSGSIAPCETRKGLDGGRHAGTRGRRP
jgi:thiosulfate/3-mercaptopyruvate sulfurtransferase